MDRIDDMVNNRQLVGYLYYDDRPFYKRNPFKCIYIFVPNKIDNFELKGEVGARCFEYEKTK